jgi:Reverse transcriptase (RNA-dependent DNA polymerase)
VSRFVLWRARVSSPSLTGCLLVELLWQWTPVHLNNLKAGERRSIIRSSMFIKVKFDAGGSFKKLKARLVSGGNQQDKSIYDDFAAPTVSTSSVFMVLSIAATEGRRMATLDIGGAFLNAAMETGVQVHMRLDRTMTSMLTSIEANDQQIINGSRNSALDSVYGAVVYAIILGLPIISHVCDKCLCHSAALLSRTARLWHKHYGIVESERYGINTYRRPSPTWDMIGIRWLRIQQQHTRSPMHFRGSR